MDFVNFVLKQEELIKEDEKYSMMHNIIQNARIEEIGTDQSKINIQTQYNYELPELIGTNQYASGRCWIFASLNVMRAKLINANKLPKTFELSQSYIYKYHLIEQCKWVLDKGVGIRDPIKYRKHMKRAISDGGEWNMVIYLIKRYGIVPKEVFPDKIQDKKTEMLNIILSTILCKGTMELRSITTKRKRNIAKLELLKECVRVISLSIGCPPKEFMWSPDIKKIKEKAYTPFTFYKQYLKRYKFDEFISILNNPTKPYKTYIHDEKDSSYLPNTLLNLPIEMIKTAIYRMITQVKYGTYIGINYQKNVMYLDSMILNDNIGTIGKLFDINLDMNKIQMIESYNNAANHAVVITGTHKEGKEYKGWKIENSWGDGTLHMTNNYFEKYVTEYVVHKSVIPKAILETKDHIWKEEYDP